MEEAAPQPPATDGARANGATSRASKRRCEEVPHAPGAAAAGLLAETSSASGACWLPGLMPTPAGSMLRVKDRNILLPRPRCLTSHKRGASVDAVGCAVTSSSMQSSCPSTAGVSGISTGGLTIVVNPVLCLVCDMLTCWRCVGVTGTPRRRLQQAAAWGRQPRKQPGRHRRWCLRVVCSCCP